jgi:tetratricopeptide (TPR) repeat protein
MKKIFATLIISSLNLIVFAQTDNSLELKNLYASEDYDKIITEYSSKSNELTANSVYFIGMAYYMKQEDEKCIEMMELTIRKDSLNSDAYFIKGSTLNYLGEFKEAIEAIENAIKIHPESSDYFSGLGDSYLSLNEYEKALNAYKEATTKENSIDRPFTMIPQIYSALEKSEEALKAFYVAKENISKEGDSYITVLFNIGLLELLKDNYDKAETVFKELIEINPEDYHSYSKIIQIYYAKKEYKKAIPYREKLYKAYNEGILKDNLKEMFCFDQFEWNGKFIQAFEKFEEKKGELYYKHLFYVMNNKDEIEFRIQTENSPISVELGGPKYLIGRDKDGEHSTFNFGLNEEFDYDLLKEYVIKVLEEKVKPTARSRKN